MIKELLKISLITILLMSLLGTGRITRPSTPSKYLTLPETTPPIVVTSYISEDLDPKEERYLSYIPEEFKEAVKINSKRYAVPIEYIYRVMFIESRLGLYLESFKPNANGTIDQGVMHLNSAYQRQFAEDYFLGDPDDFDVFNPDHNIQVACALLLDLSNELSEWEGAFVSYNGGIGNYIKGNSSKEAKNYGRVVMGKLPIGTYINLKDIILF